MLWMAYALGLASVSAVVYRFPAEMLRDPLEKAASEFRFLVAVVLGSFLGRAITAWKERCVSQRSNSDRSLQLTLRPGTSMSLLRSEFAPWLRRRKNYAALCGNTRALIVTLSTFLPLPSQAKGGTSAGGGLDRRREVRMRMCRYAVLALELAILKARGIQAGSNFGGEPHALLLAVPAITTPLLAT